MNEEVVEQIRKQKKLSENFEQITQHVRRNQFGPDYVVVLIKLCKQSIIIIISLCEKLTSSSWVGIYGPDFEASTLRWHSEVRWWKRSTDKSSRHATELFQTKVEPTQRQIYRRTQKKSKRNTWNISHNLGLTSLNSFKLTMIRRRLCGKWLMSSAKVATKTLQVTMPITQLKTNSASST